MVPVTYARPDEFTSPKWARTFAAGCRGPVCTTATLQPGPVALFGTPALWPLLNTAIQSGRDWYYGDHAYFRRQQYFRITKNRYQHDGRPHPTRPLDYQRLRECGVGDCAPWRDSGSHVVVCPNSPVYMGLFGLDAHAWALDVITRLSHYTDRPVLIRWKRQAARRPLAIDLVDAWAVVVFSSNAAVEGLIAGIPCITLAPFAASARMGRTALTDIENLSYPDDRDPFLATLAANQWTFEEMQRGEAWQVLKDD